MRSLPLQSLQSFRLGACLLAVLLLAAGAVAQMEDPFEPDDGETITPVARQETVPAPDLTQPGKAVDKTIDKMVEYFVKMYGQHLESRDWVKRAMAVISLSRIDDPRTTEKLLEVMESDRRQVVRVFAWEALHARAGSLSPAQRQRWMKAGWALAARGALRGELRLGLLELMATTGPTPATRKAFLKLFANTNSLDPGDIPVLSRMREVLARWRDPEIIKVLITRMSDINDAYRAEFVLGGLGAGIPPAASLRAKGSKAMWAETQEKWVAWFKQTNPTAVVPKNPRPYTGRSHLLPPPRRITDPRDPAWRKELELGDLHLDHLDVTFAIDSTGSMTEVVAWIKRDVLKMMRAFGMISREPRIGVTFYRDHGDAYVVRMYKLTGDGRALAQAISGASAKGGGDVPEAVYEALWTVVKKQHWTRRDDAVKVVILVGDAAPHPQTIGRIQSLVTRAAKRGFRFYTVKARTRYGSEDLSSFDDIARWGKGKSIEAEFSVGQPLERTVSRSVGIATALADDYEPYRLVVSEVLKSVLSEGYHDRAEPFVRVLMEYLELPVPERRAHFPPPPKPRPVRRTGAERRRGGRRRVDVHPKPYDPQAR